MIERKDAEALTRAVTTIMREASAKISARVAEVEKRIDEVAALQPLKPAPVDLEALAERAAALIPAPQDGTNGADGRDGKDAVIDIDAIVASAVAKIPPPDVWHGVDGKDGKDGKDAVVDMDAIVAAAVSKIPVPRICVDGKDGKDGRDADEAAVLEKIEQKLVSEILGIKSEIAQWPRPENGKDADPNVVADLVMRALTLEMRASIDALKKEVEAWPRALDGKDGINGKDAEPVDIDAIVESVLKQIPPPKELRIEEIAAKVVSLVGVPRDGVDGKDGRDGKDADLVALVDHIKVEVDSAIKALPPPRIDEEAIITRAVERIPKPQDGRDADLDDVRRVIAEEVARAVSELPRAKDGKEGPAGPPGRDAEPVKTETLEALISRQLEAHIAQIPQPENGKDGKDGRDGTSVGPEDVEPLLKQMVAAEIAQLPKPADGKDGKDGESVHPDSIHVMIRRALDEEIAKIPKPIDGKDGRDGVNGRDGESVHPDTVQTLIRKALDEELQRIPKPIDGKDGAPGRDGESVHPDTIALMVRKALDEEIQKIPKPVDGRAGEPGRDALQLEILPWIDSSKSYPPRTYAAHNGGTWISLRQTTAGSEVDLSEWACIQDSLVKFEVVQEPDLRTFSMISIKASGAKDVQQFKIPVQLYRGGYKNGDTYERGDTVTRDGSQWTCQVDSTAAVPGFSHDWRLSVRRGEAAKENKSSNGDTPKKPISLS